MINCRIFKSDRKSDTYLFLAADCLFEDLPENLRTTFGEPVFVMDLTLGTDSKLARMNTQSVLESLQEPGYFLQLPPELPLEEEISRRFS
jgi:uncharacterized protein YcgL (UPF0745 family)